MEAGEGELQVGGVLSGRKLSPAAIWRSWSDSEMHSDWLGRALWEWGRSAELREGRKVTLAGARIHANVPPVCRSVTVNSPRPSVLCHIGTTRLGCAAAACSCRRSLPPEILLHRAGGRRGHDQTCREP